MSEAFGGLFFGIVIGAFCASSITSCSRDADMERAAICAFSVGADAASWRADECLQRYSYDWRRERGYVANDTDPQP